MMALCILAASVRAELPVIATMKRAALFYRDNVSVHGGYVYHYSLDLQQRWGEGRATESQIWVQPPGTPTVGLAFLAAFEASNDRFYLDAAKDATNALIYGQLESGGWTNSIDFLPNSPRTAAYRNGNGRGRNHSSLDDGQTQSALRLIMNVDQALQFEDARIHESAEVALDALLNAQFPNGAFPQVWTGPVAAKPITPARYPQHDWRTEGRIKNYWDMYTLNDNVCGEVAQALIDAYHIYKEERYFVALKKLGEFLILAHMPDPQPAWAQQYNYKMEPIWARKFEPPAIAGDESQEAIETLIAIAAVTGDHKYLEPIPKALSYLESSLLPDGYLARYYELETNKPLFMTRKGNSYELTYSDQKLASHYSWKSKSRLTDLKKDYDAVKSGRSPSRTIVPIEMARKTVEALDHQGRWVSSYSGKRLVGQAKFRQGENYLSSEVFSKNLTLLSRFALDE